MNLTPMQSDEALALARLRQWAHDRVNLAQPRTQRQKHNGWERRDERTFDARLVRVIDFGRALASLTPQEQIALVLRYRDRETAGRISIAAGCGERQVEGGADQTLQLVDGLETHVQQHVVHGGGALRPDELEQAFQLMGGFDVGVTGLEAKEHVAGEVEALGFPFDRFQRGGKQ